jgi:DNA replication protein DnaC
VTEPILLRRRGPSRPGDATAEQEQARADFQARRRLDRIPARFRAEGRPHRDVLGWCDRFLTAPSEAGGLLLTGPVGTGKTWTAWAVYRHLVLSGWRGSFEAWSVPWLLEQLRPGGDPDVLDRCRTCSLLLLDDLGAERLSGWTVDRLHLLVDGRYERVLPTVVTSNVPRRELADAVGDRVASRLLEDATVVALTGPDRRLG